MCGVRFAIGKTLENAVVLRTDLLHLCQRSLPSGPDLVVIKIQCLQRFVVLVVLEPVNATTHEKHVHVSHTHTLPERQVWRHPSAPRANSVHRSVRNEILGCEA